MSCLFYGNMAPPVKYEDCVEKEILRYSTYSKGWYFGEGSPPSATVVEQAIELLHTAQTYSFFVDSALGVDGEIEIVVYHDNDRLQFIITEKNGIDFELERKSDLSKPFLPEDETEVICYEEGVTFDYAITKINNLGRGIWTTYTSALLNPTGFTTRVLLTEGSAAVHSGIRQTGQVYPAYPLAA
ncbi:MAG: hypothetical protein HQK99_12355 [Nitrospirae bacterium]|nr:hypothetical protein [Nitrospirota bacterium]